MRLKKELNLDGTAKEIFVRSAYIIQEMIESIINSTIFPKPQKGDTEFKRRTKEESNIQSVENLKGFMTILGCLIARIS